MLVALLAFNLLAALVCLGLAYGCWQLQRQLRQLQRQLHTWEQGLAMGLPMATVQLTQGQYGLVQAQQQYALWQRRRALLVQILQLLHQVRGAWPRFNRGFPLR